MRWRRDPVANRLVANQMQRFFDSLDSSVRASPVDTARSYVRYLFDERASRLVEQERFGRAQFHVGIGVESAGFDRLTKRSALVADTLLLSHSNSGDRQYVGRFPTRHAHGRARAAAGSYCIIDHELHCCCPDLGELGRWVLAAESLLRAGIAWYLPKFSLDQVSTRRFYSREFNQTSSEKKAVDVPSLLDFMQVGHRVVAVDNTSPVASAIVRPVVNELDLPFLDGVSLKEFSAITAGEFNSYQAFQSWLRQRLLSVEPALNAVDSERELTRIGLEIRDEVRALESQMRAVRKNRAVAATGAAVGTVTATLTAVLADPQLVALIAGFAGGTTASGGLWGIVRARTEHNPRTFRDSPWYYVWTLSRTDRS